MGKQSGTRYSSTRAKEQAQRQQRKDDSWILETREVIVATVTFRQAPRSGGERQQAAAKDPDMVC